MIEGTLAVPGATLRYEVRGTGPVLVLIPGGTGGAASLAGVAAELAEGFTVLTYDPRGMGGSLLTDPGAVQSVREHADDVWRLVEHVAPGARVRVFGASSGAITALEMVAGRPERVVRAVVHEPPVVEMLADAERHRDMVRRMVAALEGEGLMAAAAVFAAGMTDGDGDPETASDGAGVEAAPDLPPEAAARAAQTLAALPYFLGRIVPAFMACRPDLAGLGALPDLPRRLTIAVGADSAPELPHRAAAALAARLSLEPRRFPGGHVGLTTHPAEFVSLLRAEFGG